jgi:hypothetical protein
MTVSFSWTDTGAGYTVKKDRISGASLLFFHKSTVYEKIIVHYFTHMEREVVFFCVGTIHTDVTVFYEKTFF